MMLDNAYWSGRYQANQIGWDAGAITTPLKEYFDQLSDKEIKILIPGAGNSYEAGYLYERGFKNVFVCDFAQEPLDNFQFKYPGFNSENLLLKDFFELEGDYDLIVEQTFFCAIDRRLRLKYVEKVHNLLKQGGKLVGLLWKDEFDGGPPFGGSEDEYNRLFEPYFEFEVFEESYNSIKPRSGRELFVNFKKR